VTRGKAVNHAEITRLVIPVGSLVEVVLVKRRQEYVLLQICFCVFAFSWYKRTKTEERIFSGLYIYVGGPPPILK